jgi:hypothetical protein
MPTLLSLLTCIRIRTEGKNEKEKMTDTQRKSATDLFLALDRIGVSALSDDQCCQLLAWLHNDKGSNEASVHHWALNRDIQVAQQRLNIYGGENPNGELMGLFNEYRQELETAKKKPEWFDAIETKYNLKKEKP